MGRNQGQHCVLNEGRSIYLRFMSTHDLSNLHIEFAGASDVGMLRENNEDAWWAGNLTEKAQGSQEAFAGKVAIAEGAWLGVCDGLGGANAGEVASSMAITEVHSALAKVSRGQVSLARSHEALLQSNAAINQAANANMGWIGMGTTLSFVWAEREGAMLGQVGDSRIYRLRDKRLQEVSPDHSPVGRLRQSGRLTEAEARVHPTRHVIDQCLGGDDAGLRPDCLPLELKLDDVILLCSDGLTDGVVDAEIASMMGEISDELRTLSDVAQLLIKSANRQSGRDNVTVIVARLVA
ncbi:MAG: Stp1/IreP family PP2C-type Ser/Thr phosphatase [Synoicihabitans sp.]